jgi:hypothetical protein
LEGGFLGPGFVLWFWVCSLKRGIFSGLSSRACLLGPKSFYGPGLFLDPRCSLRSFINPDAVLDRNGYRHRLYIFSLITSLRYTMKLRRMKPIIKRQSESPRAKR